MQVKGYRPDIDGLRTLAVVPVVLFHAGFAGFSGGFVGVDVFFVISGYLITGNIVANVDRGRFSILGFYDRRIRRIFPALMAMIAAVMAGGLVLLIPSELIDLAKSAISAVLFSSNIWFWKTANYFGPSPQELPLLHTWSLAAEEQFYIVWPLVIAVLARPRWRRYLLPFTLLSLVLSLLMAEGLLRYSASTAFYMFPPRAWELLLGAVIAIAPKARLRSQVERQTASLAGAALVVSSVTLYSSYTRFPGLHAAVPAIGAALLILANEQQDTWAAKVLGTKLFVGVGLISYSLYLWHWPVLALHYLASGGPASFLTSAMLVALSFALAYLSWRFVEGPFRHANHGKSAEPADQRRVIATGLASMVAVAAFASLLLFTGGLPQRLPKAAQVADGYPVKPFVPVVGCVTKVATEKEFMANCLATPQERGATTVVWGDSHARALAPGLIDKAARVHRGVVAIVMDACAPLPGVATTKTRASFADIHARQPCGRANDQTFKAILASKTITTVVIGGRWNRFNPLSALPGEEAETARYLIDSKSDEISQANTFRVLEDSLSYVATRLSQAGKTLVIVNQAPSFPYSARKCTVRSRWRGENDDACAIDAGSVSRQRTNVNRVFGRVAATHRNVRLVNLLPALCKSGKCQASVGNAPLYIDSHHLSRAGSDGAAQAFPVEYFGSVRPAAKPAVADSNDAQ